jgi:hypothetical protein
MNFSQNHKGSTMVLVLLCLLIFMSMAIGFTFDSRAQSALNSGTKLHGYYRVTSEQVLNLMRHDLGWTYKTSNPLTISNDDVPKLRFGGLLQGDFSGSVEAGPYGILYQTGTTSQNAGLLNLYYKVWVANNPDDPAFTLDGTELNPGDPENALTIDPTWDTDGKVILTAELFADDTATVPLFAVTHMVAVSGASETALGQDVGQESSNVGDAANTGQGSLGNQETLNAVGQDQLSVSM